MRCRTSSIRGSSYGIGISRAGELPPAHFSFELREGSLIAKARKDENTKREQVTEWIVREDGLGVVIAAI